MRSTRISHMLGAAVDIILPPQSWINRSDLIVTPRGDHWDDIRFIDEPCCVCCGFPFAFDSGLEPTCGDCLTKPPVFSRARSAFVYDENSRGLVLGFKHGGRTENLSMFAAQMIRAGRNLLPDADLIVPVPLHPRRLIKRRFNQAALLAAPVARRSGLKVAAHILRRTRATPSQGEQTAKGRLRNVQGAFAVPGRYKAELKGKRVVLIDDVMTTGATLSACARTLKRAGASHIDVLTLARTVREM